MFTLEVMTARWLQHEEVECLWQVINYFSFLPVHIMRRGFLIGIRLMLEIFIETLTTLAK